MGCAKRSKVSGRFLKTKKSKKKKTTKKGNRRKGAVRGARLAYDAVPKKKKRKRKKKTGIFSGI